MSSCTVGVKSEVSTVSKNHDLTSGLEREGFSVLWETGGAANRLQVSEVINNSGARYDWNIMKRVFRMGIGLETVLQYLSRDEFHAPSPFCRRERYFHGRPS